MTVSTIIVSYNTAQLTLQAIGSVLKNYQDDKILGEVIVVDNNSSDDSINQITKHFGSQITLIKNKTNTGFASANNLAIQKSSGEYVFLLNSDATVHAHAIVNLVDVFTRYPTQMATALQAHTQEFDRVGIVSGQLLFPDGSLQVQGGALPSVWTIFLWWVLPIPASWLPSSWSYHIESRHFFDQEQLIGWVAGTAMMIKRSVINQIGFLDENIFMYSEDSELCLRASKHHYDVVYTPTAKITHIGSASGHKNHSLFLEIKTLQYVLAKHYTSTQNHAFHFFFRIGALLRLFLFGILLRSVEKKQLYTQILSEVFTGSNHA